MGHKLYIVDDDDFMRAALIRQLRQAGYRTEDYASAGLFLEAYSQHEPAVLILDLKMPGIDGSALQRLLAGQGARLPVIVVTGAADVPGAVAAMRLGAVDVLEKPFDGNVLLERIRLAIGRDNEAREHEARLLAAERRLAGLTATERRILRLLSAGHSTKAIAIRLDLSVRTVESHRYNIKRKTGAKSLAEMICLGMRGAGKETA
jgi:FixJ family two-component response regulator